MSVDGLEEKVTLNERRRGEERNNTTRYKGTRRHEDVRHESKSSEEKLAHVDSGFLSVDPGL